MAQIVAIGADHAGFSLKEQLKETIHSMDFEIVDLGTHNQQPIDYPDIAEKVASCIISDKANFGIIICGSGIGISIAANRFNSIRAALCHNEETARLARQHNDANILALGARITDEQTAKQCVSTFLTTSFAQGRHQQRVKKLNNLV